MSNSGPQAAARGVVEETKGKLKEVTGVLTGDESMKHEGQAQQKKADAERDVARHEAAAEASRAEAKMHEAEQRANQ